MTQKNLHVILSPALTYLYNLSGSDVVIIDILRATTTICEAFNNGVNTIIPVASVSEAEEYRKHGYATAAERNGMQVEGFDFGNSPFSFTPEAVKNKTIVFTTTNGTRCIEQAREAGAKQILIGSFLNIDALCARLKSSTNDLFLFCAGWKDKFNLEDTLFAGALVHNLRAFYHVDDDAAEMAEDLFKCSKDDLRGYVAKASHTKRFDALGIAGDTDFCFNTNTSVLIPYLRDEKIVI